MWPDCFLIFDKWVGYGKIGLREVWRSRNELPSFVFFIGWFGVLRSYIDFSLNDHVGFCLKTFLTGFLYKNGEKMKNLQTKLSINVFN